MHTKKLIAAVAVLAATGSAFAQGNSEYVDFSNVVSTKTRAEVRAELAQAAAQGQLVQSEYVEFSNVGSPTPHNVIRAEAGKPVTESLLDSRPEYVEFVNVASNRSRDEVRSEILHTVQHGDSTIGG